MTAEAAVAAVAAEAAEAEVEVADAGAVGNDGKQVVTAGKRQQQQQ
jgi:hypothetical protein